MVGLFSVLLLGSLVAFVVFGVLYLQAAVKKLPDKRYGLGILVSLVLFVVGIAGTLILYTPQEADIVHSENGIEVNLMAHRNQPMETEYQVEPEQTEVMPEQSQDQYLTDSEISTTEDRVEDYEVDINTVEYLPDSEMSYTEALTEDVIEMNATEVQDEQPAVNSPPVAAEHVPNPTTAPVPTPEPVIEDSIPARWYVGGNLHSATVAEWRTATYENKLATAADFIAWLYTNDLVNFQITDANSILPFAIELAVALDAIANENNLMDSNAVTEIVPFIIVLMEWV